jgi:hypothetical protein
MWSLHWFTIVLHIVFRIHRINMFLSLPDQDPLVRGMDPDSYHQAKILRKTLIPTVL